MKFSVLTLIVASLSATGLASPIPEAEPSGLLNIPLPNENVGELAQHLVSYVEEILHSAALDPLGEINNTPTDAIPGLITNLTDVIQDLEGTLDSLTKSLPVNANLVNILLTEIDTVLNGLLSTVNSIVTPVLDGKPVPTPTTVIEDALSQAVSVIDQVTSLAASATSTTLATPLPPLATDAPLDAVVSTVGGVVGTVSNLLNNLFKGKSH